MSKSDVWMPLYIGDYLADTMHLTGPEHGAYVLLLMHSWRTGALPDDDRSLAAIARTAPAAWKGMAATIRAFFTVTPAGLVSPRLEREREAASTNAERRTAAASKAASARWQTHTQSNAPRMRHALPKALPEACPPPSPSPEEEDSISFASQTHPGKPGAARRKPKPKLTSDFAEFWRLYPRKIGKGQAEKAWLTALNATDNDAEPIILGLKVALSLDRLDMREDGRFCPHPATWLNGKRWLDGMDPESDAQPSLIPQH